MFGGPVMAILIEKLEANGCSHLFVQGELQRKFGKFEVHEFYTNSLKEEIYSPQQ